MRLQVNPGRESRQLLDQSDSNAVSSLRPVFLFLLRCHIQLDGVEPYDLQGGTAVGTFADVALVNVIIHLNFPITFRAGSSWHLLDPSRVLARMPPVADDALAARSFRTIASKKPKNALSVRARNCREAAISKPKAVPNASSNQ